MPSYQFIEVTYMSRVLGFYPRHVKFKSSPGSLVKTSSQLIAPGCYLLTLVVQGHNCSITLVASLKTVIKNWYHIKFMVWTQNRRYISFIFNINKEEIGQIRFVMASLKTENLE
jgi:hypothetical protein